MVNKIQRRFSRSRNGQWIKHNPSRIALYKGDVGQIVATYLINAIRHFIQAVMHIQLRLTL
ncbi:Uncharacterised protein [Vibrio cholerae]|nr:Uncharacterised protein [Vibrio cholerae]CSD02453.1 Uncharacterised protein [Vibrio cholerae]CSI01037.1 Uncharacterised protein [Vibrio cholerae]CSI92036.1 Uncharacterised protein [Vibrio cholerae]